MGRLMESTESSANVIRNDENAKQNPCLALLQDVVTEGNSAQLQSLRASLTDHHAVVLCRHHNALNIVSDAWRRNIDDVKVAASAASILLLYAKVHADTLRRLDVCALCRETLCALGAVKDLVSVGQLWRRLAGPCAADALTVFSKSNGEAATLRPLLQGLMEQKDVCELQHSDSQSVLQGMLAMQGVAADVMRVLCRIAEPIKVPACDRGGLDDQSDGSNSEDDSDVEGGESIQGATKMKKKKVLQISVPGSVTSTRESRVSGFQTFIERHASEAASGELGTDASMTNDVPSKPSAALLLQEFQAHLGIEPTSAAAWPVVFPLRTSDDQQVVPGQDVRFFKDFEGGNLRQVRAESDGCFELLLCGDTNRSAYCQWFFFDVETEKDLHARFHIVTLTKASSTFADGQRVVAMVPGDGCWRRAGEDYAYFPNRYMVGTRKGHFTLAFSMHLTAGRTRIAYFYPYVFGDLLQDLRRLSPTEKDWLELRDLGPTQGGRALPMLTITDFAVESPHQRPHVVIMARVHPGEAPASYVMRGVLELLLAHTSEAEVLRQTFIFAVFPMLNPDGVANGNGRSSNTGHDLNRCWENPPPGSEVAAVKPVLESLCASSGGVFALLDLHAHSVRNGAFTFGNPGAEALPDRVSKISAAQFKEKSAIDGVASSGSNSIGLFDRTQCTFKYPTGAKRGAARCVAWQEFGISHAHTVESTYSCMNRDGNQRFVAVHDLCELGRHLVHACAEIARQPNEKEPVKGKRRVASKKKSSGPVFELVL